MVERVLQVGTSSRRLPLRPMLGIKRPMTACVGAHVRVTALLTYCRSDPSGWQHTTPVHSSYQRLKEL